MKRQKTDCPELNDINTLNNTLEAEYKRQIDYYKSEEKKAKEQLRQFEKEFLLQRQELESKLEDQLAISSDLRLQLLSLQNKSNINTNIEKIPNQSVSDKDTTINKLNEEINKYKKEIESLKVYKNSYDTYIAEGGFDYMQDRILHCIDNPLKQKNDAKHEALQCQIEELQHALKQISQATSLSSSPMISVSNKETSNLQSPPTFTALPSVAAKDEIESLKKRIERMKEVFAAQSNRFRDAVYQLMGWNLELSVMENKLRLRSRYAESQNDYIELLWNGTDKFELLDTSFVNKIDPNLFAAITINLFEKQTIFSNPV